MATNMDQTLTARRSLRLKLKCLWSEAGHQKRNTDWQNCCIVFSWPLSH